MKKLEKEHKTISVMIRMFCGAHHGTDGGDLCSDCEELFGYAQERLKRCPFGENKGACSKCRVHCYKPNMRKRIAEVMRYSGPRMIRKHPLLAIDHLLKARGVKLGKKRGGS